MYKDSTLDCSRTASSSRYEKDCRLPDPWEDLKIRSPLYIPYIISHMVLGGSTSLDPFGGLDGSTRALSSSCEDGVRILELLPNLL